MKIERVRVTRSEPTVTVVVPCYNYGHYLPEVVRSILDQDGVRVDVVIVDDASPDGSGDVARSLADAEERVTLIRHIENKRHIATYNDGLAAATGEYVVLLSADDLLAPGSLHRATSLLELHPDIGFVYGHCSDFVDRPTPSSGGWPTWTTWTGEEWIRRICAGGTNVITSPEVVMRRSVMDDIGGYDAGLPHTADLLVWLRAASRAGVGRTNGADQAYYRVHGANMHLTDFSNVLTDIAERHRAFEQLVDLDFADRPVAGDALRRIYRRTLAREAIDWAALNVDRDGSRTDIDALLRFAAEVAPEQLDGRAGRRLRRRLARGRRSAVGRRMAEVRRTVRHKVLWRRRRLLGY